MSKANKNKKNTAEKEPFYLFIKDQGKGAARVIVIILKITSLVLTTIYALVMGVFAPLCIWYGDIADPEIAASPAIMFWLIAAIIYLIGTFVLMMGHSKIASVIHTLGAVGTLITYYLLFPFFPEGGGPSGLYMPCLFIMVISVIIMMLINVPKWLDKRTARNNEKAPSIIEEDE